MLNNIIRFFLENKLVTILILFFIVIWGTITSPFDFKINFLPRDPVPVDAIPDIGENQQIVFTEWMGRSPQDVENQITYPLTTSLLGLPGVKDVRSTSMFGFSSIYIIFEEDIEYYWSRSRILEKLNALPEGLLPEGVQPRLGPDATGLGQVYFYTLEGRDEKGNPVGGWDLNELRTIQDFYVQYGLASAAGVSEVAAIGGHVKEYQVDLDPIALKSHEVPLMAVIEAIQNSNQDIGANTLEMNMVEYLVRGLGYVKEIEDIEDAVVMVNNNVPLRIKDIAKVSTGPASRTEKAVLDKGGAEVAGGVVVARYGSNPLEVINNVKEKIKEISPGLPSKTLEDGTVSKVTIVPFYDRSGLIYETLGTLYEAINLQILITVLVIVVMVYNLRASFLIAALLPMAVLMCFIFMKYFQVEANIVALSGIAIAIGTMVDMGIILSENILRHLKVAQEGKSKLTIFYEATTEVASAILTAVATTIVSFLPVFALQGAEGKLFGPLAYTKTFALIAALIFSLVIMPALAHWLFGLEVNNRRVKKNVNIALVAVGIIVLFLGHIGSGFILVALGANNLLQGYYPKGRISYHTVVLVTIVTFAISWLLAIAWLPLGPTNSLFMNFSFIVLLMLLFPGGFSLFVRFYPRVLGWCLEHKATFLAIPAMIVLIGFVAWLGFANVFGFVAKGTDKLGWNIRTTSGWSKMAHTFPGLGKEFMPSLDEGAFLLMPTSMPHSGIEANIHVLKQMDRAVAAIPEVEMVVGKAGRAESALDPAPMNMFENIINYKSEYMTDENGKRLRFGINENGEFLRDDNGNLIQDSKGEFYRQWRDHIKSPDDIWQEIVNSVNIPGVTSAPKLQPIETRQIMLQTGMRAPMGIKVYGPDLETIETFSIKLENLLKEVPGVKQESVFADRSLGKPYLEIAIDRNAIGRYGLNIADVQEYIALAVGGMTLSTTVEGRERFAIRARYAREYRNSPEAIEKILISTPTGAHVPLGQIAKIDYRPGPMMIRGENTFLLGYVLLDKEEGFSEVAVVENAQIFLDQKIKDGTLVVPTGVSYKFSGNYENQVRAEKRMSYLIPLSLLIIFLILYFQFRSVSKVFMIFSGIAMALAGGFLMIWLYGQSWFMDFSILGMNIRELFQMNTMNMSVAVWVGFIALFGIATDDGVVMGTYLMQSFKNKNFTSREDIRKAVIKAGMKRINPCLMTTATTVLALLPVLTSTGRGSDIMIPMAVPVFGGMVVALITVLIVPVLYAMQAEYKLKKTLSDATL